MVTRGKRVKWEVSPVMGGDCRCASDGRPAGVGLANGAGEEGEAVFSISGEGRENKINE